MPGLALVIIAALTLLLGRPASADDGLPPRSAAELLVDLQRSVGVGLSGTVVQQVDLGLPALPGVSGTSPGSTGGDSSLTSTISGTHTWKVWLDGPTRQRLALMGDLGESDVIRNGTDVWVWSSRDKTASHRALAPRDTRSAPATAPTDLPRTPQEAAQRALAAIEPSTQVTTSGTSTVAGRPAYELVLKPKDTAARVAQVRVAVDADQGVPLRVQVYSTAAANPSVDVAFTAVDFATPEADRFVFTPPPGTTVTESTAGAAGHRDGDATRVTGDRSSKVVGSGWGAVMVATMPVPEAGTAGSAQQRQLTALVRGLPPVSGPWGSGRLFDGPLFSVVVTDDGRVAVGAVAPDRLYAALAAP